MDVLKEAKEFAIKAHKGQVRKSDPEKPMVIHPINVGNILIENDKKLQNIFCKRFLSTEL